MFDAITRIRYIPYIEPNNCKINFREEKKVLSSSRFSLYVTSTLFYPVVAILALPLIGYLGYLYLREYQAAQKLHQMNNTPLETLVQAEKVKLEKDLNLSKKIFKIYYPNTYILQPEAINNLISAISPNDKIRDVKIKTL